MKGWRTILFNGLSAAILVAVPLTGYLAGFNWTSLGVSVEAAMWIALGMNAANIILRVVTTSPIGRADE